MKTRDGRTSEKTLDISIRVRTPFNRSTLIRAGRRIRTSRPNPPFATRLRRTPTRDASCTPLLLDSAAQAAWTSLNCHGATEPSPPGTLRHGSRPLSSTRRESVAQDKSRALYRSIHAHGGSCVPVFPRARYAHWQAPSHAVGHHAEREYRRCNCYCSLHALDKLSDCYKITPGLDLWLDAYPCNIDSKVQKKKGNGKRTGAKIIHV